MSEAANRRRRFSVDALFTDTSPRAEGVRDHSEARIIRLDRIQPDPDQPRHDFDEQALHELAASIRQEGVLQPIAVRWDAEQGTYIVIHGERRWRASHLAGLTEIPAIVRDVPDDRRLVQQLMENILREDLNALERAAALRVLKQQMDDAPWERVAEAVGIRRSRLFQLLGTEKLAPSVQDALRSGVVSEKQTRAIGALERNTQEEVGDRLLRGDLDRRSLEAEVRRLRATMPGGNTPLPVQRKPLTPLVEITVRTLTSALDELDPTNLPADEPARLRAALIVARSRIDQFLERLPVERD